MERERRLSFFFFVLSSSLILRAIELSHTFFPTSSLAES